MKKLINKIFGELQYIVTVCDMYGSVSKHKFTYIKEIDDFVDELNEPGNYQYMIQKIEKIRVFTFKYNKEIIHTPLGFQVEGVTEKHSVNDYPYSFFKIDDSLAKVTRKR